MSVRLVSMATGGVVVSVGRKRWFLVDPETLAIMRQLAGRPVPERFPVDPTGFCNATPGVAPTFAGFFDPGHPRRWYCEPASTRPYNELWRRAQHEMARRDRAATARIQAQLDQMFWGASR